MPSFLPELTRRAFGVLALAAVVPAAAMAQGQPNLAITYTSYLWGATSEAPYNATDGANSTSALVSNVPYNGFQETYAQANLAAGTLRARSGGTATDINASAHAEFGDAFGAIDVATGQAHVWQPGETVTFNFSVTGSVQSTLSAADMARLDKGFMSSARFDFYAYKPGASVIAARVRELYDQGWSDDVLAEIGRLNTELEGLKITSSYTYLGRQYSPYYDASNEPFLEVSANVPTVISTSFAPGGSFEWGAQLEVGTRFSADVPLGYRPTFIIDFSHTVGASFIGPDGTVTTSASGLFPNTVSAVPEPQTYILALAGLAAATLLGRKRRA